MTDPTINVDQLRRENDRTERNVRNIDRIINSDRRQGPDLGNRLNYPKGAVSGGGGRGAHHGVLSDFFTRDEFIGRAGTIGRAVTGGRLLGAWLAFSSIEEMGRAVLDFMRSDKSFDQIISDTFARLMPSFLRETIPAILSEELRKERERMLYEVKAAALQNDLERRLEYDHSFKDNFYRWQQLREGDREELGRLMSEAQSRRY